MEMNHRNQSHTADLLFTIGLFCVFAAAAFILVMIGIQAYQNTVEHMQDTFSTRAAISYVAEKLRQHDAYVTYIYSDGETLYELTVRDGTEVTASMGEQIMAVRDFTISDAGDGFYAFSASDSGGRTVRFLTHLRSGA